MSGQPAMMVSVVLAKRIIFITTFFSTIIANYGKLGCQLKAKLPEAFTERTTPPSMDFSTDPNFVVEPVPDSFRSIASAVRG